jgi:hypothetical protein
MSSRVLRLLPKALLHLFTKTNPPPPKAVAMVKALADADRSDVQLRRLYDDLIDLWPEYADARVTTAEVERLIASDPE